MPSSPSSSSPAPQDPILGMLVAQKYRVHKLVARGGMGRIYLAEQQPLGRLVALKVLDSQYAAGDIDPEFERRFLLEAATCARLHHPNTVTVFDYGRLDLPDASTWYMVMEFIEGMTLRRLLKREGPLDPIRAVSIAREVARSLREAHGLGLVHRDLKPTNVMLVETEEGEAVKVLDFGIVKLLSDDDAPSADLTAGGRFLGTPRYMAPEQIQRMAIDARADIYSLGVLLYELLTGKPPFTGDPMQVVLAHLKEAPPPLAERAPGPVPDDVVALVTRCLRKVPSNRFPDATAFIDAADDILSASITGPVGRDSRSLGVISRATVDARALEAAEITTGPKTLPAQEKPSRLWLIILLVAALVGGIGALLLSLTRTDRSGIDTPAIGSARSDGLRAAGQPADPGIGAAEPPPIAPTADAAAAEGQGTADAAPPDAAPVPLPPRTIQITSRPPGAAVYADGSRIGKTPLAVELGPDGTREIELRLAGHTTRTLKLDEQSPATIEQALPRRPAPRKRPKPPPAPGLDIRTSR